MSNIGDDGDDDDDDNDDEDYVDGGGGGGDGGFDDNDTYIGVDFGGSWACAPNNWEMPIISLVIATFCSSNILVGPNIFDAV